MSIQNTTRGSLCGPCPTTNYAYMFPRKNYRFVGKIKVIASPEAKAPLCLWLEAPGVELSSFWTTVTEPSPSHKRTNKQFVNTAVKSWLNIEINWLIIDHISLNSNNHVNLWFVIFNYNEYLYYNRTRRSCLWQRLDSRIRHYRNFLFQIMISHVYFQIYSILEKTYQLCTSEIMNLVLHIGIVWKRLGRKWLGLFKAREEKEKTIQWNEICWNV